MHLPRATGPARPRRASCGAELEPTPDEIKERRRELVPLTRTERAGLVSFFEFCSFVELRRRTRQDLDVTGNAHWEVLRNAAGEVARPVYVPLYTMRLLSLDAEPVPVEESVRISPVTVERVTTRQRMRRFLQVHYTPLTFFKAFVDPRFVSRPQARSSPASSSSAPATPPTAPPPRSSTSLFPRRDRRTASRHGAAVCWP